LKDFDPYAALSPPRVGDRSQDEGVRPPGSEDGRDRSKQNVLSPQGAAPPTEARMGRRPSALGGEGPISSVPLHLSESVEAKLSAHHLMGGEEKAAASTSSLSIPVSSLSSSSTSSAFSPVQSGTTSAAGQPTAHTVSNYSSAALSSGRFTAISVSPVSQPSSSITPNSAHSSAIAAGGTPGDQTSKNNSSVTLTSHAPTNNNEDHPEFFAHPELAAAAATALADSKQSTQLPRVHHHSATATPSQTVAAGSTDAPTPASLLAFNPSLRHLKPESQPQPEIDTTPSVVSPVMHPSPSSSSASQRRDSKDWSLTSKQHELSESGSRSRSGSGSSASGSGGDAVSASESSSSGSASVSAPTVKFDEQPTIIDESTRPQPLTQQRRQSSSETNSPSALRIHDESPDQQQQQQQLTEEELQRRRASPPKHAVARLRTTMKAPAPDEEDEFEKADKEERAKLPQSARRRMRGEEGDEQLPPVVSRLMAAQRIAGTAPGTTLSVPMEFERRLIFICGDASGAGKSSIAMGLLHLLMRRGYDASELAYIKPCTQCEDVQLVNKFCEKNGIAHQGLGPVIFYEGFTAEVIDGKTESVEKRRARVQKAVNRISEGKKWVIVDGVGYAAVGSVAGVSNAEVASLLNAPVLVVGRPGIGNSIDAMNFILAYFHAHHVYTVGACWNRVPPMHSYHSYEACKHYVTKYYKELKHGSISTYGHIPLISIKKPETDSSTSTASPPPLPAETVACRLRPAKRDLEMTQEEEVFVEHFLRTMEKEFDMETLMADLNRYYQAHRVQLVAVI